MREVSANNRRRSNCLHGIIINAMLERQKETHERLAAKEAEIETKASVPSDRAMEEAAMEERRESYPTRHSDY